MTGDVGRIRRAFRWLNRHPLVITVVLLSLAVAGGIRAVQQEAQARQRGEHAARIAQVRSQVQVSREGCQDRNVRDGKAYAGIRAIAARQGTPPALYAPLTEALAPRNCKALYPMPDKNGKVRRGSDDRNVAFTSCTEARAAGMTPLFEGQPGYSKRLDRDGDGVACE